MTGKLTQRALVRNIVSRVRGGRGRVVVGTATGVGSVDGERGAVLILALVFLLVGSLTITTLASWTTTSLSSTLRFNSARADLYAADAATQLAITTSRYQYPQGASYPCPGTTPSIQIGTGSGSSSPYVADWCVAQTFTGFNEYQASLGITATREITFSACLTSINVTLTQNCQNPIVTAIVAFNDNVLVNAVGATVPQDNCTSLSNESNCGASMFVVSWKAQQTSGT